jgi:electron transfer flavoprotein beta subunit
VKIGVLLKQVPATDTRIKINAGGTGIESGGVKLEINPYDEHALEEALKLKDAKKAGQVVVISIGGAGNDQRIRDGLARGADTGLWIDDPALEGADSLTIAKVLAAAAKAEGVGLLIAGKQAVDDDNAQVPAMVAELLGWPQALVISELSVDGDAFQATRDIGGGLRQVVKGALPAVLSADKALNTPRYASLPGIMKARRKPIAKKTAGDLGVAVGEPMVADANWTLPPERPAGRILQGEAADVVAELVNLLRTEAKVL